MSIPSSWVWVLHQFLESEQKRIGNSIQTTWPENKGRVDCQRNMKLLYRREAIGQAKIMHVHHGKYIGTQGDHATSVGDTLRVLNDHLESP